MLRLVHIHRPLGHANPHFLDRTRFLNPAHPAAKLALRNLPFFISPHFSIRAFPNAILHKPADFVPINPLLATRLLRANRREHNAREEANVSLLFHTSKKATSKSCVVRRRLRSKMTTAIRLVVAGASERLVLQDWTFLVVPDLAIYKAPLPTLVQTVRKALLSLSRQSQRLESAWSALPKSQSMTRASRSRATAFKSSPVEPKPVHHQVG